MTLSGGISRGPTRYAHIDDDSTFRSRFDRCMTDRVLVMSLCAQSRLQCGATASFAGDAQRRRRSLPINVTTLSNSCLYLQLTHAFDGATNRPHGRMLAVHATAATCERRVAVHRRRRSATRFARAPGSPPFRVCVCVLSLSPRLFCFN
jgi:hypothetical protein